MSVAAPWLALTIFVVAFVLIATERVHRVAGAVAAGLMAVLGLVPGSKIFFSEHAGIDWNVIFLLLGMMIIVGVLQADRRLRVPRDLGGQAGPRPARSG